MRLVRLLGVVLLALVARAFAADAHPAHAPVLLISMDGFRWDYPTLHPEQTPHIRQLAHDGVTAAHGLIPVFPSNTFPNHYAIVTGLYPSHSGIINNRMFDAKLGERFVYTQTKSARDSRWWGGEPIWITAVLQGKKSACAFWPGSEAEIKGVHATFWKPYDYSVPFEQRLDELVKWLKLPPDQRPAVTTFYLEETNSAGHRYGPDSPQLAAAVQLLDGRIAAIEARLAAEHLPVNYVLVADHGMSSCGPDHVLMLGDFIDLKTVQVDFDESVCGLRPSRGASVDGILKELAKMPHAKAYRAADLPARFHIDAENPRVPPIWVLPDEGWQVLRGGLSNSLDRFIKGQHGYDPALPNMHGIFIASGPAFKSGVTIPETANVNIYNLLCAAAGLQPAANDGDDSLVRAVLK